MNMCRRRVVLLTVNTISDLTSLAGLTQLTLLDLDGNAISDISALADLTNLVVLRLGGNVITDISALSGLTHLVVLRLWDNNISDISPLVANRGLGAGEVISVSENPLNDASINVYIPTLQDRGVEVHFFDLKPPLEQFFAVGAGGSEPDSYPAEKSHL